MENPDRTGADIDPVLPPIREISGLKGVPRPCSSRIVRSMYDTCTTRLGLIPVSFLPYFWAWGRHLQHDEVYLWFA